MKKSAITASLLFSIHLALPAAESHVSPGVSDLRLIKNGTELLVGMTIDPSGLKMNGNRELEIIPIIINGTDTLRMKSVTIAGRNRFFRHLRNDGTDAAPVYRADEITDPIVYRDETVYSPWMENATLAVETVESGCCSATVASGISPIALLDLEPETFSPSYAYVSPKAEAVKTRTINARAYIDFPVNKTVIYPDYRRNPAELAKIRATIDSVKNDRDLTITSIHIKGFASPEGSYAGNSRLAEGRTAALSGYVSRLYQFQPNTLSTSFEPEDWQGLRQFVASAEGRGAVMNADAIIAIIDSPRYDGDDDAREAALKKEFPADYRWLLENVYPALRHSDYAITYNIRSFTSPEDIIKVMHTAPQNLSLQEFYLLAQSQEPGSDLYNEAFETAVRMYPSDPVANLNAAFSAMRRNDLAGAERYLEKSGDSPEARYGRAILTAIKGDHAAALSILTTLPDSPYKKEAEESLRKIIDADGRNYIPISDTIKLPSQAADKNQ